MKKKTEKVKERKVKIKKITWSEYDFKVNEFEEPNRQVKSSYSYPISSKLGIFDISRVLRISLKSSKNGNAFRVAPSSPLITNPKFSNFLLYEEQCLLTSTWLNHIYPLFLNLYNFHCLCVVPSLPIRFAFFIPISFHLFDLYFHGSFFNLFLVFVL